MRNHRVSVWERESFLKYDVIIIGGGIIGLSSAIECKLADPRLSVAVLERGLLPGGASTKNAGFACFGSLTEILSDMETLGHDETLRIIDERCRGLRLLRDRLGDDEIAYNECGGYELIFANDSEVLSRIDEVNASLHQLFSGDVFTLRNDLMTTFGMNTERLSALIANPLEGHIHTGRMMRALAQYAAGLGVVIHTGALVNTIEEESEHVKVIVEDATSSEEIAFNASTIAVCTNAFIPKLLPNVPIVPGRGQVLLTSPIPNLTLKGTFHFDAGYYYFRDLGDRILFGGGRNLDFERERSTEFTENTMITDELERLLREVIAPGKEYTIEQRWQGIMGFSDTKLPIVQRTSNRVVVGFGCNGMGVALGSRIGELVCRQVVG